MVEVRFKGFDAMQWYGSVGPASLQPDVAKQLNESQVAVLKTSDQRHKLLGEAFEPWPMSPEQFGKFIRSEKLRGGPLSPRHVTSSLRSAPALRQQAVN